MTWLLVLLGCAHPVPPAPTPATAAWPADSTALTVRGQMNHHFADILTLEERVIRGDLDGARAAGRRVSAGAVSPDYPELWRPWLDDAKAAGEAASWATDLDKAGAAAGQAMLACGECHIGSNSGPKWDVLARPDASAMMVHEYGVNWMGYGIMAPSDAAWTRGADALLTSPVPTTGPEGVEARVRFLASEAKKTTDHDGRAKLWGQLLGTCASCHVPKQP